MPEYTFRLAGQLFVEAQITVEAQTPEEAIEALAEKGLKNAHWEADELRPHAVNVEVLDLQESNDEDEDAIELGWEAKAANEEGEAPEVLDAKTGRKRLKDTQG